MTADDFVHTMFSAKPDRAQLEEYGLDAEEIASIFAAFECSARPDSQTTPALNAVETLLAKYDCSSLAVSQFRFAKAATSLSSGTLIGWWEADPVILSAADAVIAIDHADNARIICRCAESSEGFLDALALIVQATANKANWRGRAGLLAKKCASAAGLGGDTAFYDALCAFLGHGDLR